MLLNAGLGDLYAYTQRYYFGACARCNEKWRVGVDYISQGFRGGRKEYFAHAWDVAFVKLPDTIYTGDDFI